MNELVLRHGDCLHVLADMPEASVGAVVCDPPYGLNFFGENWDDLSAVKHANRGTLTNMVNASGKPKFHTQAPAFDLSPSSQVAMQEWHREWLAACYRVLVPNGVLKAFSATRTFHRMSAAMQEAGFTDLHLEAWAYSTGFPKSKNLALFIDKALGATGDRGRAIPMASTHFPGGGKYGLEGEAERLTSNPVPPYAPVTSEARTWAGFGTALKPSWEPVLVGRKPL